MRLITTQTGRLRMDVCSEYVLENKEQRSSQMARFPGRRTAQRESTHEGPATKIKEFQSINNIKGDMMKVDRYHGMDRTQSNVFRSFFMPSTFTDEAFHDLGCPFQRIIRKSEIVNIIRRMAITGQPNIYAQGCFDETGG